MFRIITAALLVLWAIASAVAADVDNPQTNASNISSGTLAIARLQNVLFAVHQATGQSLSGSMAKITFDTVELNPQTAWSTANKNFNPQVAGTYEVCYSVTISGTLTVGTSTALVDISKNGLSGSGGTIVAESVEVAVSTGFYDTASNCFLVAMNGSTDTLEIDALAQGTNPVISNTNNRTIFSGRLVGS